MKLRWSTLVVGLLHAVSSTAYTQAAPAPSPAGEAEVVAWLRANAIPLRSVQAGTPLDDLRPLETVLQNVRILGMGESSHGASEFQRTKHRLFEFLVTRMGFTEFAIEAAYSDAQSANDYVLEGRGNRDSVLTALGYVAWDTEEMAAQLDWMRAYNKTVPVAKKVRFHGTDIFRNAVGRKRVSAFVHRYAPAGAASTDSLFRELAVQEDRWPLWDTTVTLRARTGLEALASDLTARRISLRGQVAEAEYDEVLRFIEVMRQGTVAQDRSQWMADNLSYLVERAPPGTKFVYSAHDSHILTTNPSRAGFHLRQRYGSSYYALSLTFDRGSFQARSFPPPGDFRIAAADPSPAGSLAWFLARPGIPLFFLDLRSTPRAPSIDAWLRAPHAARTPGWAYGDANRFFSMVVHERFDGVLFVSEVTPTHPTANAMNTIARRVGF